MLRARSSLSIVAALASIVAVSPGRAAAETSVSGRWKLTYEVEAQSKDYFLELKQDGGKVSGSFISPRSGRKDEIANGSFEGGKLKFNVMRANNETIAVEATAKGDAKLEGTIGINDHAGIPVVITKAVSVPIAGKWSVTSKTADGQQYTSTIELTDDGGVLKGKSTSTLGTFELASPKLEGEKFSFEIVLPIDGNQVAFLVSANLVEGNKLSGRWKTRDADFSGEWLASKEAAAVAEKPVAAPTAPPLAPAAKVIAGKWFAVSTTPKEGKKSFQLELAADGNKLTGKVHTPHGAIDIKDGKAVDRKIEFTFPLQADGKDVQVKVEAEIDAHDMLQGKWTSSSGETGELSGRKPVVL